MWKKSNGGYYKGNDMDGALVPRVSVWGNIRVLEMDGGDSYKTVHLFTRRFYICFVEEKITMGKVWPMPKLSLWPSGLANPSCSHYCSFLQFSCVFNF